MKTNQTPITWKFHFRKLTGGLAVLGLLSIAPANHAADVIKADNSDNLNLGSSWSNGVAPTSSDVAVWDSTVTAANLVQLGANTNWAGIRITTPGGAVTLGVNALALTVTAANPNLAYTVAPVNPLVNGDRAYITVGTGGTVPAGFTAFTSYHVVNATPTTFQLSATAGGAAITPTTAGSLVLVTGGGTLTLGASGIDTSGGSQPLILPGPVVISAAQDWSVVSAVAVNGGLSGAAASGNDVTLTSGTLSIGGRGMTLSNLVVNSGATVSISGGGLGIVALNGGTFSVNGAINEGLNVLAGGGIEQNTGGNRTWSGNLTGSGPLTVNASSLHTWNGVNTSYNGTLTLQGSGTLRISALNSVSASTAYIFNNGNMTANATGIFNLGSLGGAGTLFGNAGQNYSIGALGGDTDYSGTISGGTRVIKTGPGTLTLSGANAYSGGTVISNGVLQVGNSGATGALGTGTVTNLSKLVFNRSGALTLLNVITGTGSVTNIGSGKVSLTGANNYTGPTIVTAGTLAVGTASAVTSDYTVGDSATLGAVVTSSGATLTEGNVTFGSGCSYEFDLGTFGNPTGPVVTNTGLVTLNGNVTVNVLGTNLVNGTITLLRYTSRGGAGSFVLGTLPPNVNLVSFNDDTVNKQVTLTFTVGAVVDTTLKWLGGAAGDWDNDNVANQIWQEIGTGQPTNYYSGAAVRFDDSATGTTNVNLTTAISPLSVTVSNSAKTYTFFGAGDLTGGTGLTKQGSGALIVSNANTYSGQTRIESGSLKIIGDVGAIGAGGVTNSGALIIDKTAATNALPNTLIFAGQITGTGSLTYLGADKTNSILQVEVGANDGNPYSGGTLISNGYVRLNANPVTDPTRSAAKSTGLGTGLITFLGNSILELEDYGVANTSAQSGNFATPVHVPAGQTAELRTAGRAAVSSTLTGAGTLNLGVSYVRDDITGNFSAFTGQINVFASPLAGGNDFRVLNTAGFPLAKVNIGERVTMQSQAGSGSVFPVGELSGVEGATLGFGNTATWRVGGLNTDATNAANFSSGNLNLIKEGTGVWTLSGTNLDYTGSTTISNGVLALTTNLLGDVSIPNSATIRLSAPGILDVSSRSDGTFRLGALTNNQALLGNGTIRGSLLVGSLGTLTPGFSLGTLTVTNSVTLGGTTVMELDRTALTNSDRIVSLASAISAGGTLTVTNIGVALQTGDAFQLFSTNVTGSFAAVNLPTNDPVTLTAYTWTNKLSIDGSIAVLTAVAPPSVNTTPTNITFSASGGNLTLAWPSDHTGWTLQVQTNTRAVGLNTNWFNVGGSSTTNQVVVPIGIGDGTVFYRLVYP